MKEGGGSPNPGHLLYHQPPLNQGPNPSHQQGTATPTMAANVWPQQVGLNYWLPAYYYYYQWQQLLLQSLAGRPLQEVKENGQIRGAGGPNWEQGKGEEEQGKGREEQGKELPLSFEASYKRVVESPAWLPPGWITEMQTRRSGSSAGTRDKYYKDLMSGRRFRSRNEVIKFLLTGKGRVRCRRKHRVLGITSPPATAQLCGTSPLKDRHLLEAPCAGQSCQLAEGSFDHLAVSPVVDATQLFEMESLEEKPNCHASSHVAERPVLGAVQQCKESSPKEQSNSPAASLILTALIEAQMQDKRPSNGIERHFLETHIPAQIHDKRASSGDPETHDKRPSNGVERHALETHVPTSNEAEIHDKRPSSCVERHALEMPVSASIEAQIHEKRLNDGAKRHALETYVLPLIEAQINENRSSNGIERHALETYDAAKLSCEDRKPIHIIETSASGVPDGVSQCDEERAKSSVSKPPSVTQSCRNGWLGETPYNAMERHADDRLQNSFLRARTNNAHEQPVWEVLDEVYHDGKKIAVENTMSVMTSSVPKPSSLLQPCGSSMPSETPSNATERSAGDKAQLLNNIFLGRVLNNAMGGGALTGFDPCANSLPGERLNYPIKSPGSEAFARVPLCVKSLFGGKPNSALQMCVSEPLSAVQSCETSLRGEVPYNALERHVLQAHTSGQLCENSLSGKALNNVISSPVLKTFNEAHLSSFRKKNNSMTESHLSRPFLAVTPCEKDSLREKSNQSRENYVLEAINGGQVPDNDLPLPRLDSGTELRASVKAPTEIALCITSLCREKHHSAAMERSNLEGLNSPQTRGNSLFLGRSDNASIEKSIMETTTAAERHKKSLLKVRPRAGKEKLGLGASKGAQLCKRPFSKRPVLKAAYTVILACPAPLSTIRELRRSQGHKQASSGLGVSSIAPDKEVQHKQASSGLAVSSIASDKEEEHKQASSGLAVSNIAPDKEEEHKQASSGLGVCNIAPDKEGQHKQASSGLEASNMAGLAVSNVAPDKEGDSTQAISGLGASSIAPDKEGQQIQAIPGLGVSSMAPDKEEQLHTRPSEGTCQFKGLFGSYKAAISGQKRPAQHSPSKLPVQKKIKFHSPKKGEDKQGSRLWQWLQQSGTVAKKQELVKQGMPTVNPNEPTIAEQRCMIMQPLDKMVSSCSGIPPASEKEREIETANIDASMCTKIQPDHTLIYSAKEVPLALVKAREIEAANVDASRGMKMQPANTTICLAKEVPLALGNTREIQTVKMDAHLGKETHASPNNIKVGKTVQSYQQLVIHPSMMNVQSSVAQALLVNPWLCSTSCLEIGSQAAESCTVLGSERSCLPHLAREETQSTQEFGRGVVQVSQHQRVHPTEPRLNIGRDSEMQVSMLNAQSSASQALQDNAQLPSAHACFPPSATGLQAAELCSGGGCFPHLAREKTQLAQTHHILGNLHFSRIDNHSGCFFTQLGDAGRMQNPAGRDRGSFAHTQLGKSTGLDLIHTQLGTGNHPGCFFTQCGDAGPTQTPPAGDIGSAHTQLDKNAGLDQIQTTPLGTDIQVAAQTHSPLVHSSELVRETGESSTQLAVREQEKKKKREAERRLEAVLYPKLDLSKLSPGLSSRQKAKVVQKLRAKHGRELLATLGRQLCQRALQQGETVTNEKLATPILQLGASPKI